ncbi:YlbE-like family protein [Terrilactibacillus laevilacticus]|uniref:YlbE-like family protein n=1 Tax=Terrilactibacillus laevilacticus TaxID=1380157 RepID=A0ABW5PQ42_9BACI|nr:YlbE-like family protein [Terrilactibacillus laevilacticus]
MRREIQYYLTSAPEIKRYIRMNPEWYIKLSRYPNEYPRLVKEANEYYGRTFSKRMDKFNERVSFLSMLMDMAMSMQDNNQESDMSANEDK